MSNEFYDTSVLSQEDKARRLELAFKVCSSWWLDKLDCRMSFARQKIPDITFNEALHYFGPNAHHSYIIRRENLGLPDYLEVSLTAMSSPVEHFLWVIVPLDKSAEILDGLG